MPKQWKENPPGPEQLALEAMFDQGEIEDHDTPATIKANHPLFADFSDRVFTSHFKKTMARFGGYAKTSDQQNDAVIPELGLIGAVASTSQSRKRPLALASLDTDPNIQFKNAPYVTWVYTDHVKKCEMVCVAVSMISGARNVNFVLCEDNVTLNVTYIWPSAIYSPEELFRSKLTNEGGWTINHPKIHAFMVRLVECELTERALPQASIVIKLPVKVLRESNTYTKSGIMTKDGLIVMLEFQAFQKQQIIQDVDTSIKFESCNLSQNKSFFL